METAEFNEPDLTIMDRVDNSPQRSQVRKIIEHSLNVNKQRMVGNDTLDWYCKLRQGKEYDHEYDGINTNIQKNFADDNDEDGKAFGMVIGKRNNSLFAMKSGIGAAI